LQALTGVVAGSTSLGTFTGSTIADNSTVKVALQALETDLEAQTDDQTAAEVSFTPGGNLASTDVQAALLELDSEKLALAGGTMTGAINMGTNAITNAGAITGTTLTGTTITDGTFSVTTGAVTGATSIGTGSLTATGVITGGTLTDGTLSITGGNLSTTGTLTGTNLSGTNTGDQNASQVLVTPSGNLGSSQVQAALYELQGDIDGLSVSSHPAVTLGTANGLALSTQELSLALATTSAAGAMSGADKTKLDGIASSANNYIHPNHTGDVTSVGDGAQTITNGAVTYAKIQNVSTNNRLLGRATAASGLVEEAIVGTGLTLDDATTTLTANLSVGKGNNQNVIGGNSAVGSLTLISTNNGTKGKILFGTSAYDEGNNRLGIGNSTPSVALDVTGAITSSSAITGNSIVKTGGTSSQFLKADGSVDENAYVTSTGTIANFSGSLSGDVTGTQGATIVSNVGAVTAANVASGVNLANAATPLNSFGAIVMRDGSGNFSAGTISAALVGNVTGNVTGSSGSTTGNAASATALAIARNIYGNSFDGTADLNQIIASTYGGTGNGFTKFTGPTTSERTFTLPDANATLARTDASQTFSGTQTFSDLISGSLGLTVTGAAINLNNNSATSITNISTGTTTGAVTIGNANNSVAINGIIPGANPLVFDGATADAFRTTLAFTDPTAVNTITFPDASGTVALVGGSTSWSTLGNASTDPATNFIGTSDNRDMVFRTNNLESMRIEAATGDLLFGGASVGTVKANQELILRQDGDTYGPSILRLRNRNDENGAIFETTDPTITLVDFIFKTASNQRNIRYESRGGGVARTGNPSFHIGGADGGGADPDNPTLSIGDNYSAFNKPLRIGNYALPTAWLHLPAGTATANTAPLKLSAGTNLNTAEAGAIEYDGTNFYGTNSSPTRRTFAFLDSPVFTTPDIGEAVGTSLAVTGAITSSGSAGIGYASGAGGTVTQSSSKSNSVTINRLSGAITMNNASLANVTLVSFTVFNNTVEADDVPVIAISGNANAGYLCSVTDVADGSFRISIRNVSGGVLSQAIVINFVVIKGTTVN
jgi:hypothetical protein